MTEKEAIERIRKSICNERGIAEHCHDNCMYGIEHCAFSLAIQALEEIQKYRSTGLSPDLIEAMKGHNVALMVQTEELMEEAKGKVIGEFAEEITTWMKGARYITVDETSTKMTEEFEKEHQWELSRNSFIGYAIREITEIAERMKNGEIN